MSLQTRVTVPATIPGDLLAREIGVKLQQTAEEILTGVQPDKYPGAVERYKVLYELLIWMEDYIAREAKGETPLDDE
jgi:hypothetical protein